MFIGTISDPPTKLLSPRIKEVLAWAGALCAGSQLGDLPRIGRTQPPKNKVSADGSALSVYSGRFNHPVVLGEIRV